MVALPGEPLFLGYSWPGVFLLGAGGRTGRFLTQLLFRDPITSQLAIETLIWSLCYERTLGLKGAAPRVVVGSNYDLEES